MILAGGCCRLLPHRDGDSCVRGGGVSRWCTEQGEGTPTIRNEDTSTGYQGKWGCRAGVRFCLIDHHASCSCCLHVAWTQTGSFFRRLFEACFIVWRGTHQKYGCYVCPTVMSTIKKSGNARRFVLSPS